MYTYEAEKIVRDLLRKDYFGSMTPAQRVFDGELYALEASLAEDCTWSEEEYEALAIFARLSPAERAEALDLVEVLQYDEDTHERVEVNNRRM